MIFTSDRPFKCIFLWDRLSLYIFVVYRRFRRKESGHLRFELLRTRTREAFDRLTSFLGPSRSDRQMEMDEELECAMEWNYKKSWYWNLFFCQPFIWIPLHSSIFKSFLETAYYILYYMYIPRLFTPGLDLLTPGIQPFPNDFAFKRLATEDRIQWGNSSVWIYHCCATWDHIEVHLDACSGTIVLLMLT